MGGKKTAFALVSVLALATASVAHAQHAEGNTPKGSDTPNADRKRGTLTFSVPLVSEARAFGDVLIEVGQKNQVSIETLSLRRELEAILNDVGLSALDQAIKGRSFVSPEVLRPAGFDVQFDTGQLELRLASVKAEYLQTKRIGTDYGSSGRVDLKTIAPAGFSTFVNVTGNYDYDTRAGSRAPEIFLDGATRVGGVVLEYEGAFTDQFGGKYKFYRRNTRAVYDDPSSYRRYSAGDLRLNSLSILRTPQIGGVAIEKGRQIFDPFYSVTRLGGRQIFLDNSSTVDVLINGVKFESLQLDAGTYDLSDLPIQQGSNDIRLLVRDSFGQQRVIDYNFFFEPLTLPAGEEEYSLGFGVLSDTFGFEPRYGKDIAASGYYRKALSENLILGGGFQASQDIQVIGATTSVVPQFVPGVFDLELAGSRSDAGSGLALRAGYRYQAGNELGRSSQLSLNLDYESGAFTTIDALQPIGFDLLSLSGSYSQSFSSRTYAVLGGSYTSRGGRAQDDYSVFFDVNHRVTPRIRATAGVEYGLATAFRSAFGVRVGLTMALGGRTRASADYRSRTESYRATMSRGADSQIGSFGYDLSVAKFGDDTQGDLQMNYVANRFEARANLTTGGNSLGGVFDDQRARLQVGTSLAYADGTFGIGRPIDNSFALIQPHEALQESGIITARSLSRSSYYARSGALGAAVQGDLSAYSEQSVQYDAAEVGAGFDVGDGVVLVDPPYKSGYRVVIGSEHFVTVIGILADENGAIALGTGTVTAVDSDEEFKASPFYTNSAGRFGVFGLAPGQSYKVTLAETGRTFTIKIPSDTGALVRSGTIMLPTAE